MNEIIGPEDQARSQNLMARTKLLEAANVELFSLVALWVAAMAPIEPDMEWKGQGWIGNAHKWLKILLFAHQAKTIAIVEEVKEDARKCFHVLNELRAQAMREAPDEYARFIEEANRLADLSRELID
jgi:hypothetical protein